MVSPLDRTRGRGAAVSRSWFGRSATAAPRDSGLVRGGRALARAAARAAALDRGPLGALGQGLDGLDLQAAGSTEVLAQALEREAHQVALRELRLARGRLEPVDLVAADQVRALLQPAGSLRCHGGPPGRLMECVPR